MRKSPFNYLIAVLISAFLFVITALFIGNTYSQSLMLAESTPDEFLSYFTIILAIAACCGLFGCLIWFIVGSKESTAARLKQAQSVWWISFIVQVVISIALLVILIIHNNSEAIPGSQWIGAYVMILIHTWVYFWFMSFMFSPRAVKYIPLFK